jgi:hypothetical protein
MIDTGAMTLHLRRLAAVVVFALTTFDLVDGRSPALADGNGSPGARQSTLSSPHRQSADAEYCCARSTLVEPIALPVSVPSPEMPARAPRVDTARGFLTPPSPPPRAIR